MEIIFVYFLSCALIFGLVTSLYLTLKTIKLI